MSIFNINKILELTARYRDGTAVKVELTPQQQAILDAVNGGRWGCQDSSVRALVTAITGIDCTNKTDVRWPVGTMVVFDDETLLIRSVDSDGDAMFFTKSGKTETANSGWCYINHDQCRFATDEEIAAFFA